MANRERGAKLKSKQRKQRPKKLKFGHVPGIEHFKVAAEARTSHKTLIWPGSTQRLKTRNTSPKRSLRNLPTEILVDIFKHIGTVDHAILLLCSKQLLRVSQDLTGAVFLLRYGSFD